MKKWQHTEPAPIGTTTSLVVASGLIRPLVCVVMMGLGLASLLFKREIWIAGKTPGLFVSNQKVKFGFHESHPEKWAPATTTLFVVILCAILWSTILLAVWCVI